jgi:PPOX class probable F420-dependent enzyme
LCHRARELEKRRLINGLNDKVREILSRKYFAVLATINQDGSPQQTVMWYELIGDRIMMNTAAGRLKEANMTRDPRVSVCVEDEYNYVTLTGRTTLDYDPEQAQADIARLARRYHPPEKAEQLITSFQQEKRITIWVDIEHIITKF